MLHHITTSPLPLLWVAVWNQTAAPLLLKKYLRISVTFRPFYTACRRQEFWVFVLPLQSFYKMYKYRTERLCGSVLSQMYQQWTLASRVTSNQLEQGSKFNIRFLWQSKSTVWLDVKFNFDPRYLLCICIFMIVHVPFLKHQFDPSLLYVHAVSFGKILNHELALTENLLPINALYECLCEGVNGNKLSVVTTRKVLYKYRPFYTATREAETWIKPPTTTALPPQPHCWDKPNHY